jgi:hypothetical protein
VLKREIPDIFSGSKWIEYEENINCFNALISYFDRIGSCITLGWTKVGLPGSPPLPVPVD